MIYEGSLFGFKKRSLRADMISAQVHKGCHGEDGQKLSTVTRIRNDVYKLQQSDCL